MTQQKNKKDDVFDFIDKKLQTSPNIVNLAVGNPIGKPNKVLLDSLCHYIQEKDMHGYGSFSPEINKKLLESIAHYYSARFGVDLIPEENFIEVQGTKVAIYRLISLLINKGEKVLLPSPTYTVYTKCVELLNGEIIYFPCDQETFYPDLNKISEKQLKDAKLMILCSPGNPTSAVLTKVFFEKAISLAKKYNFKIINDLAYAEIRYNHNEVSSIFSVDGAEEVSVELYSLSKSCNIAGWRIGFVCGNKEIIAQLKELQFNIEFGLFLPFQKAAITALENLPQISKLEIAKYEERINYFIVEMKKVNWTISKPKASFFIWTKIPHKYSYMSDKEFVIYVLKETNILFSPGSGFGKGGEGFVRIALVQEMEVLKKVVSKLQVLLE
ncbi:pyridoxal phosphate-dependent aminotransferase [Enterococcus rivorum]|uniref:pyridoxal phosphate-dependent aminotransferase n=1 Tax=Enterococcus rivorum TaxID=762845 RepID=UPI000AE0C30E|nr:LL-diaminopimelate aminotransferase/alanine-synthesizing transaminase [Enterococcus rivorum]